MVKCVRANGKFIWKGKEAKCEKNNISKCTDLPSSDFYSVKYKTKKTLRIGIVSCTKTRKKAKSFRILCNCAKNGCNWEQKKQLFDINNSDCVNEKPPMTFQTGSNKIDANLVCPAGADESRILNGENAKKSLWPWLVRIQTHDHDFREEFFEQTCHGVSVGPGWVLTDALCCHHADEWAKLKSATGVNAESNHFDGTAGEWLIHPKYNIVSAKTSQETSDSPSQYNFCMMGHDEGRMDQDEWTTDYACLPTKPPPEGAWCWLASWGNTEGDPFEYRDYDDYDWMPQKLQQKGLNIFSNDYCKAHSKYEVFHVHYESQFCAGTPDKNNDGLSDVGAGWGLTDHGAPLICNVDGTPVVYGIVAYSQGLEKGFTFDPNKPGHPIIFGNVWKVAEWIKAVMENPNTAPRKDREFNGLDGIDFDDIYGR